MKLPENLKAEYPFKQNYLDLDCGKMHFVDEGKGIPVLMIHGNPTWSFFYRNLIKELKNDFRCIAPDHIGCGLSDKPQDHEYTLWNHIKHLIQLVEHLKLEKFHLVIHDWGGPTGMALAQYFSEKVEKITILNTAAFHLKRLPLSIRICRIPFLGKLIIRGFNGFARPSTSMSVTKKLSADVKAGYLFPYNNWANRIATHEFVRDIPLSPTHRSYACLKNVELNLQKLKDKEIEIHWADDDFVFHGAFLKKWREIYPAAKVHTYTDTGHYILEDAKDQVLANVKAFLLN